VIHTKTITVRVRIMDEGKTRTVRLKQGATALDLLQKLGIGRETVIVRVNGRVSPEEEMLKAGDRVEVLKIVTGG